MKHKTFLLLILCTIISSCVSLYTEESDVNEEHSSRIPISLVSGIVELNTKTRMNGSIFENDDKIGLYILKQPNNILDSRYGDNCQYTYTNNGFQGAESIYYPDEYTLCDFIAYYPYNEKGFTNEGNTIVVTTMANQSTPNAFSESDFMLAKTFNVKPSRNAVLLNFSHKFAKINISVKIPEISQPEEMLKTLAVKFDNVYTETVYNIDDDEFVFYALPQAITPYGEWEIDQEKALIKGKKAILVPQESSNCRIILQVNNRTYTSEFPADLTLESNISNHLQINYDPSIGIEAIIPSIEDWEEDDTIYESNLTEEKKNNTISISTLNFNQTSIIQIVSSEGDIMGEICKEYLLNDIIDAAALVYYSKDNPMSGKVLQLINKSGNVHGGTVVWNTNNTFDYTPGNHNLITSLCIDENGNFIESPANDSPNIVAREYMLVDTRSSITERYGVVKIGTQFWMREDLRATNYSDGTTISDLTSDLAATVAGFYTNRGNYFYNFKAVNSLKMSPDGWSIPNTSQWELLFNYVNNESAKIKSLNWTIYDGITVSNNITGFECMAIGNYYQVVSPTKFFGYNEYVNYWCWSAVPTLTFDDRGIHISYTNNGFGSCRYNEYSGYAIRCIRD